LMVTGTTLEVTPIVSLDGRPVGDGSPGPTTRSLQAAFKEHISF
jgi:D-alanine transaminase